MISTFTSPSYVNRVKESWQPGYGVTQSGGAGSPTLYFDFLTGVLNPAITFTRASTATYFNSAGTLTSAAIDAPRFDYNPSTLAARGLLIEEARTNSIRNNTMVGAVAGTPGTLPTNWPGISLSGLSRQIVGTGTESGITYIDIRLFGTTTSALFAGIAAESTNSVAALPNSVWASTFYVRLVGGSLTNITDVKHVITNFSAAGVALNEFAISSITPTSAALSTQRYAVSTTSATFANASTAFARSFLQVEANTGVAVDITLRVGLPQFELGAFATSVIPTTTTALTRAADLASVNTLIPWYNASAGTIYTEFQTPITANAFQASFNDATTNNRVGLLSNSTQFVAARNTGGAGVLFTPGTANAPSLVNVNKSALAFANTDYALCGNGGTVATASTYNLPTVTRLELGQQLTATALNGYLRRITYYPRRLSNAELQAITA
jgi:hypothetical protein